MKNPALDALDKLSDLANSMELMSYSSAGNDSDLSRYFAVNSSSFRLDLKIIRAALTTAPESGVNYSDKVVCMQCMVNLERQGFKIFPDTTKIIGGEG